MLESSHQKKMGSSSTSRKHNFYQYIFTSFIYSLLLQICGIALSGTIGTRFFFPPRPFLAAKRFSVAGLFYWAASKHF